MHPSVTALLVSHDGSRWLPQVLDRLSRQTVPPDQVVAVDTGSRDGSLELLRARLPQGTVVAADRATGFPAAVRAGLAARDPRDADEWVWLLHDDSAPAPDALEQLLAARTTTGGAAPAVLGPKLREWPSLRRLLEIGVTVTGTGQRETGLERGEYDQGQHDEPRDVLAVNTAGMLVRRSVLETLGFDDALPVVHTDLDFGWRCARAGHRVRTVPAAVVFHAEASRNGIRGATRRRAESRPARRRVERAAAQYTVLANCSSRSVPLVLVRLLLGAVLRAIGLLLVRAPGESWAELRAAGGLLLHPGRLVAARRARRVTARVPARDVRPLLAPFWLPYRNGLDELGGILSAVAGEAGVRAGTADGGPSLLHRAAHSRRLWLAVGLGVLSLVAARELLDTGRLTGGALLPAPDSALDWWRSYLATTHDVATGSTTTAPAYLVPLGVLGTVLAGSASLAVDAVLLGAVPLAAVGSHRFLRRLGVSRSVAAWGGGSWALLLATGGALGQGRVGTLAAAALLPWLAASATALGSATASADRRRRAAWRTSLWLALVTAFAPLVWLLAAGLVAVTLVLSVAGRGLGARRAGLALLPLPVSAILLSPWAVLVWQDRSWSALVLEAGLPASSLVGALGAADVLGARAGSVAAAPAWLAWGTGLLALVALLRRSSRPSVVVCWWIAAGALAASWWLRGLEVADPLGTGTVLVWAGIPLLVLHAAWLTAAALAATGARSALSGRAFGWRQPTGVLLGLAALVLPVCGSVWWVARGADDPLTRAGTDLVPAYMDAAADRDRAEGTLVLRGSLEEGLTAEVRRGAPLALGDEAVLPRVADQAVLTAAVSDLVSLGGVGGVDALSESGVQFVFVPAPVDPALAAALDARSGVTSASADDPEARAWRLDQPATLTLPEPRDPAWLRPALLAVQLATVLVVVVLAAPTRRRST